MPTYAFDCPACGPFDISCPMGRATDPAPCPACTTASRRVYTVPGVRRAPGALSGAGRLDTARIDRARTGEPVITGPPSGRRLPRRRPHPH